jgi:hypothetical protein
MLRRKGKFTLSFIILAPLFISYCGSPKLAPTAKPIAISIAAAKLAVFDATSLVVMNRGFSIISSNERLGLITTYYKQLDQNFGGAILLDMFGKRKVEIQLTTYIVSDNGTSVLTILAKGRSQKKKGGYYDEIEFSNAFLKSIGDIG